MNSRFLKLCRLTQGTSKPGSLSHATFCLLLHEVISLCAWQKTTLRRTHLKVKFKRKSYALSMQSFHSAKERFGVDVCLTNEDLTKAPECPHGRHFRTLRYPLDFPRLFLLARETCGQKQATSLRALWESGLSLYLSYVFTKAFSDEKSKRFKLLTHDSYHRLIMAHDLQTHYRFPPPLPSKRYTVNSLLTDTVIRRTPL